MKKYQVVVILLLVVIIWLSSAVVRLENYHYAVQIGLCEEFSGAEKLAQKNECLNNSETRTGFWWHLIYGLNILR